MSAIIRWEYPPTDVREGAGRPHGAPMRDWGAVADELRPHPGRWALIALKRNPGAAAQLAHEISAGRVAHFRPAGAFESVARAVGGEYRVYARRVGDGGEA